MINWQQLETFEDWAGVLDQLLDAGNKALRDGDVATQVDVQKDLREFRRRSPNATCRKLDEIAKQAVRDIATGSLEDAITGIADRSTELDDHVRDLLAVANETQRVATWLNLETPTEIAKGLTEMVGSFKQLHAEAKKLAKGDEAVAADLEKNIDSAIVAVGKLRDLVEKSV